MQESEIKHSQVVLFFVLRSLPLFLFPSLSACLVVSRLLSRFRARVRADEFSLEGADTTAARREEEKRIQEKRQRDGYWLSRAATVPRCNGKFKLLFKLLALVSRILSRIKWFVLLSPSFVNEWKAGPVSFSLYCVHSCRTSRLARSTPSVLSVCKRERERRGERREKIVSYLPMVIIYWWEKPGSLESRCRATSEAHSNY